MSEVIPPILLVRLKSRLPDGEAVVESRRVCHLVPVPESADIPQVLRAYCGAQITPGAADVVNRASGMPCEPCLAKSPIPVFAMLRTVALATGDTVVSTQDRADVAPWWDLGLRPEQRSAARFVLLLLLQDPTRPLSIAQIALRLEQDARLVNLIMLLHAVVGWVQQAPEHQDLVWADGNYQLTEQGAALARSTLALGMTPTIAALAAGLGLDITVVYDRDPHSVEPGRQIPDPSRDGGSLNAAPTGLRHGADDTTRAQPDDQETS